MSPKVRSAIFKAPIYPLKRRRTKKLHRELLDQLEFYMSEANIRHDAFMREKAGDNGTNDVPISLFLTFPLIQEMKVTEKNIIKSIEKSVVLEMSDDKIYIRRRYPISGPPHNLDDSTLYIENLPPDCTIEWLKDVCLKTGSVRHISLPRYKRSGRIKGFAFIEYSSAEDVARACRIFRDLPKNFYPSRTAYYLANIKRNQQTKTVIDDPNPITPTRMPGLQEEPAHSASQSSSPQCQSTPIDSRKRKRSQNLDANTSSVHEEVSEEFIDHRQPKKSRKRDKSIADEEVVSTTASIPRKSKSVAFAVNHDCERVENVSHFADCNGNALVQCEQVSDKSATDLQQSLRGTIIESGNSKAVYNAHVISAPIATAGIRRKRSVSEPSVLLDEDLTQTKKFRADDAVRVTQKILSSTPGEVNAIIAQAREAVGLESPYVSPKKPILQSVVARPVAQPKKTRRSKTSRERKRLKAGRVPPDLKVMPKIEWLEFKKEYKALQKQNMSKLKRTIRENKDAGSVFIKKHLDVLHDVKTGSKLSGDYDEADPGNTSDIKEHSLLKRGPPRFQPGVIAKISIAEGASPLCQLPNIEDIKTVLNQYGQGVAYVDLRAGESHGFVRFNDGESAQRAILEEKSIALCLLTGEHEEQYWDKLLASRARKFSQERKKVRGRTKILCKAEMLVEKGKRKHIRFDNDLLSV